MTDELLTKASQTKSHISTLAQILAAVEKLVLLTAHEVIAIKDTIHDVKKRLQDDFDGL